ncbi:MAG: DUF6800 family protein [Minisyncoccales bacterium]
MSKINKKRRQFEIKKKRKRKEKIKKLKAKLLAAKTKEEKEKILEKIQKIVPHYPIEEILKLEK